MIASFTSTRGIVMTSCVVCSKNYLLATVNLTSHCYILRKFFEATKRCISCVYSRLSSYYSGSAFIITNIRHAKKTQQTRCVCVYVGGGMWRGGVNIIVLFR